MPSYKFNYLISVCITVFLALLYAVILKSSTFFEPLTLKIFTTIYIIFVGIVSPLPFFLSGKVVTTKELARPDINPDAGFALQEQKRKLSEKVNQAISENPPTKARSAKVASIKEATKGTSHNTLIVEPKKDNLSDNMHTLKSKTGSNAPLEVHDSTEELEDTVTLYVGNIPYRFNANKLRNTMAPFGGKIHFIHLLRNPNSRLHKGVAFIKISKDAGLKAIKSLNGSELGGREIVVKIANERAENEEALANNEPETIKE